MECSERARHTRRAWTNGDKYEYGRAEMGAYLDLNVNEDVGLTSCQCVTLIALSLSHALSAPPPPSLALCLALPLFHSGSKSSTGLNGCSKLFSTRSLSKW